MSEPNQAQSTIIDSASSLSISGIILQSMQSLSNESDGQIQAVLGSHTASQVFRCLQNELWPVMCTTLEHGQPQDRAKAASLLNTVLTRLIIGLKDTTDGPILEFFDLTFVKEVFVKLVGKVRDLYCCQSSVDTLCNCFVTTTSKSHPLMEQLFSDAENVNTLMSGISSPNLHLPSYTLKTRVAVLKMYQQFTVQKSLLLSKVKHPVIFIQSVLAAIEGEKDPRNLLICFDLTYFMLLAYLSQNSEFYQATDKAVIEQLEESFFDEIACYFPINFKPPKNDTHKITPEQLELMLEKCMLATPTMLKHIVPYLIEKLSDTKVAVRVQSLHVLGEIAKKFSLEELIEPTSKEQVLVQVLQEVSHVFFNVIEDQIQEKAATTIALILARLLSSQSIAAGSLITSGVTYVATSKATTSSGANGGSHTNTEVLQFIQRCVTSIQDSPESMQAGLSNLLLKTIAVTTEPLQETVARDVYLTIVEQLASGDVPLVNQVAYLTVLISLTQVISDSKYNRPLIELTMQDAKVSEKLETIVRKAIETDATSLDKVEAVRFEKLLYFYCALKDLQEKSPIDKTFFAQPESSLDTDVITFIAQTQADLILVEDDDSTQKLSKICFASLARESARRTEFVAKILHAIYQKTGNNQSILRAFFSMDLMSDLDAVKLGFQIFSTLDQSADKLWTLKPCLNSKSCSELDVLIREMIASNQGSLTFSSQLKPLVYKYTDDDAGSVDLLLQTLMQISDAQLRLQTIKYLFKVNKSARMGDLKTFIAEQTSSSLTEANDNKGRVIKHCGKLVLYIVLKMPKKADDAAQQQRNESLVNELLSEENFLAIRLQTCRALIARGDNLGFKSLISMMENFLQSGRLGEQEEFAELFGELITRALSKKWKTKERGYLNLSRFSEQRLYKLIQPVLEKYKNNFYAMQMTLQSCSLVPMSVVQAKLSELSQMMAQFNCGDNSMSEQVRLNCLSLTRKVLLEQSADNSNGSADDDIKTQITNLETFVPKILQSLQLQIDQPESQRKIAIECMLLLNDLHKMYPEQILSQHQKRVLSLASQLKNHKKRVVRTVARVTVSEWGLGN